VHVNDLLQFVDTLQSCFDSSIHVVDSVVKFRDRSEHDAHLLDASHGVVIDRDFLNAQNFSRGFEGTFNVALGLVQRRELLESLDNVLIVELTRRSDTADAESLAKGKGSFVELLLFHLEDSNIVQEASNVGVISSQHCFAEFQGHFKSANRVGVCTELVVHETEIVPDSRVEVGVRRGGFEAARLGRTNRLESLGNRSLTNVTVFRLQGALLVVNRLAGASELLKNTTNVVAGDAHRNVFVQLSKSLFQTQFLLEEEQCVLEIFLVKEQLRGKNLRFQEYRRIVRAGTERGRS